MSHFGKSQANAVLYGSPMAHNNNSSNEAFFNERGCCCKIPDERTKVFHVDFDRNQIEITLVSNAMFNFPS